MVYRPLDPNEQETPFSRELGALERQTRGRFREESMFERGQRDTPTPTHSTFYPGSLDIFGIWHNMPSHATEDHRADGESHNILYQVGGCAGCNRVETRASETAFGLAGKRQEVAINIRSGNHCAQPLTLRVLLDI